MTNFKRGKSWIDRAAGTCFPLRVSSEDYSGSRSKSKSRDRQFKIKSGRLPLVAQLGIIVAVFAVTLVIIIGVLDLINEPPHTAASPKGPAPEQPQ
jgi:hypothetical protein